MVLIVIKLLNNLANSNTGSFYYTLLYFDTLFERIPSCFELQWRKRSKVEHFVACIIWREMGLPALS